MNKRELILNTMQDLFRDGKAGTASVCDIAKRAGIAKGGLYYYFDSKEAVMDALVEREYENIISDCQKKLDSCTLNATGKMALLLYTYTSSYVDPSLDEYLHLPQNAAIHQKSLAKILLSLSSLVTPIIEQGIKEGIYKCEYPEEYSHIILSVFTFLMDPGIFSWSDLQKKRNLQALATMLEQSLQAPDGSFSFLHNPNA